MSLGLELKKALEAAGLNQLEFAQKMGRDSGNITDIIKDRRPLPDEWIDDAINALGLKQAGREEDYERFAREAILAQLGENGSALLRARFLEFDDLLVRYRRLLDSERAR